MLAVASVAQPMVVLDVTVVNIALPSAQRALAFSDADRQWVVTAYALAFGAAAAWGGFPGPAFLTGPRRARCCAGRRTRARPRPRDPAPVIYPATAA